MQKISSIHKHIQQILGSHELNDRTHFWPGPPKNYWNNFLLGSFHQFILEIQPISESHDQTGHTHFWPRPSKKSGYFIDLFWRYGWLKNPAISLAENILVHISGTRIFPNMGFVQEHSKWYKSSLYNKFSKN